MLSDSNLREITFQSPKSSLIDFFFNVYVLLLSVAYKSNIQKIFSLNENFLHFSSQELWSMGKISLWTFPSRPTGLALSLKWSLSPALTLWSREACFSFYHLMLLVLLHSLSFQFACLNTYCLFMMKPVLMSQIWKIQFWETGISN